MTITTRQDKVNRTIERVKARLAKLKSMTPDQIAKKYGKDTYWHDFDIEHAEKQLASNFKKLEEAKRLDAKEEATKGKKIKREERLSLIPESLRTFQQWLENEWIKQAIELHESLKDKPYPKYHDRSKEADLIREDRAFYSEDDVRRNAKRDSEDLVLDLMNRVEKKVGNIIDVSRLYCNAANVGMAINGWVEGDKGLTYVQSILAGGYNIQRLHVRVILH